MHVPFLSPAVLALSLLGSCATDEPVRALTIAGGESGTAMWFDPAAPDVEPGRYEITFENAGQVYHELAIVDPSGVVAAARSTPAGGSILFEAELTEAGTYQMICREPGHAAAGMVGTLRVG